MSAKKTKTPAATANSQAPKAAKANKSPKAKKVLATQPTVTPEAAQRHEQAAASEAATAKATSPADKTRAPQADKTRAKKAKEAKAKKPSALDTAAKVLRESGQPLTCPEMIAAMAAKGYWTSPHGATPAATLYSAILRETQTKGDASRFVKSERGKFTLRAKD